MIDFHGSFTVFKSLVYGIWS